MAKAIELPLNKDVLKWARTTAGLTIPQAAQELGVKTEFILDIESGHRAVSKTLLHDLARLYKRPITVLFLPEPPVEENIPTDYRLIPDQKQIIGTESANALREARRLQEVLSDLAEIPNISAFRDLSVNIKNNPAEMGSKIRQIIDVGLAEQKSWPNTGYAFREWRGKIQNLGIHVFIGDFPREEARGFSLWHPELIPTIVVSRNEVPAAQIFTLFHELAHILLRSDSMCLKREDETLLGTIEAWCNRVSATILVPESDLRNALSRYGQNIIRQWQLNELYEIASIFRVSRHVIAIRLEQIGCAMEGYYNSIKGLLDSDDYAIAKVRPRKKEDFKRNIPQERLAEVGFTAVTTILDACSNSFLSTMEAADLLRIRPSKFSKLLSLASVQSQRYK